MPYHILLSEIMLQQTRAETVKPYYLRFLEVLPQLSDLAAAPDALLLKLWEGLGYYSRVRNLKKTALILTDLYHGDFPADYDALLSLPGIGPYTAGAIASICFDLPTPAVDGNVLRVISRYIGSNQDIALEKTRRCYTKLLSDVYPVPGAGIFTQSIIELGATVCLPSGKPKCMCCPLQASCCAYTCNLTALLPVKRKQKPRKKERHTVFCLSCDAHIALKKRNESGLLSGLWELPNVPEQISEAQAFSFADAWHCAPQQLLRTAKRKHIFTHIEWEMVCYYISCQHKSENFQWVSQAELNTTYSLPTAFRKFLSP